MKWHRVRKNPCLSLDAEAYLVDDLVAQQRPSSASVAAAPDVEAGDLPDAGLPDPRVQKPQLDEPVKFSALRWKIIMS